MPAPPLFSEAERARLITDWNAPGRYEIGPRPGAQKDGAYVVRLTPDASRWFNAFNRYLKPGKLAPTKNAVEIPDAFRPWEIWVGAKVKYDRALAAQQAAFANAQLFAAPLPPATAMAPNVTTAPDVKIAPATVTPAIIPAAPTTPTTTTAPVNGTPPAIAPANPPLSPGTPPVMPTIKAAESLPPHPGPMPADLLAAIGNAPPFATVAMPRHYTVRFASGESIEYTDQISPSNPRSAYLRFAQGVASSGHVLSKMAPAELDQIFAASHLSPVEGRVMRAISLLEGGFDSINTYDTGFLSVGFIQFATLEAGSGSLGAVLLAEKKRNPADFARDFHDLGVDVTPDGFLVVVDPSSGAELRGNEAVLKIIDDKRLTAVFHLAGRRSTAFRAAQIQVAKSSYYPADLPVSVAIGGQTLTARVGDVIRSEAGLATLFDRKVNTGNIAVLNPVVQSAMLAHGLTRFDQLAPFEREIIAGVRWRSDFLKDATLTQPQKTPDF